MTSGVRIPSRRPRSAGMRWTRVALFASLGAATYAIGACRGERSAAIEACRELTTLQQDVLVRCVATLNKCVESARDRHAWVTPREGETL